MPKHILFVEDNTFMSDIFATKFIEKGYETSVCGRGDEVLAQVEKKRPDLILLDLDLPGLAGLDALKLLQAEEKMKTIPVIIFSNNDSEENRQSAKALGARDFITKASISPGELIKTVQSHLF